MSTALTISDYGVVLLAIETELEELAKQEARMLERKCILQLSANRILSDVRQVASVHTYGQIGGGYGLRGLGRAN